MKSVIRPVIFALIFVVVAVFFVGLLNLYHYIPFLDKIFHFFGGGLAAWIIIEFLRHRNHDFNPNKSWQIILIAVFAIGLIWEFAELTSTLYSSTYFPWLIKYFYTGGWVDSINDVISDLVGGLIIALSYPHTHHSHHHHK
jgi:ABC-type Fe3+-siderophore transport system permease subunit